MRITFLTPHVRISGGVKIILTYANRLVDRGHLVNVVTLPPGSLSWSRLKTGLQYITESGNLSLLKIKENFLYPKRKSDDLDWIDLKANLLYISDFQEKKMPDADIIVCAGGIDGPIVNNFGSNKGKKFVFFQHFGTHGVTKAEKAVAQMPFTKMVVASWIGELLREHYGQDSILVRNPVDADFFYPVNKQDHQDKVIGMLHHTTDWKGFADGLAAFQLVRERYPKVRLVTFGCHNIPEISREPWCIFHYDPPQESLREIYSSCDIWVCPSWTEGFGLTSVEAMACCSALVTTDNGGSRDYAFHKETALVSPPHRPDLLAQNIIRLMEDDSLRRQIATRGYELVQTFTWEAATDIMESAFLAAL